MAKFNRGSVRLALACSAAAGAMLVGAAAHAQEVPPQSEDEALITGETIVVTGSRIQRQDYEANSPIVTANEELFENSSTAAIETALNKLPAADGPDGAASDEAFARFAGATWHGNWWEMGGGAVS